jgi:hypothetical protein
MSFIAVNLRMSFIAAYLRMSFIGAMTVRIGRGEIGSVGQFADVLYWILPLFHHRLFNHYWPYFKRLKYTRSR